MIKEVLVKVAEGVLANLQVFFGKRDKAEECLLRAGEQVYRFVEGTEENVIISSKGTVLRRYPKCNRWGNFEKNYYQIVNCKPNSSDYLQVGIGKLNTKLIHRLVAETFLEKEEGKTEVDHINRDKQDNRVENLRWVSHSENMGNGHPYKTKKEDKVFWQNIKATNKETGSTIIFSKPSDIIPFAKGLGWGKGWGPAINRALLKEGFAYGYFWSGEKIHKP